MTWTRGKQSVASDARGDRVRLVDEHRLLKEERNEQQEKIKQMSTKFVRIMNDIKKSGHGTVMQLEDGVVLQKKGGRDLDAESYIAMLQTQLKVPLPLGVRPAVVPGPQGRWVWDGTQPPERKGNPPPPLCPRPSGHAAA